MINKQRLGFPSLVLTCGGFVRLLPLSRVYVIHGLLLFFLQQSLLNHYVRMQGLTISQVRTELVGFKLMEFKVLR